MESITVGDHEDQPTNSSEQVDQEEQNVGPGPGPGGRSYECMFCKRGFTTAQALGGHMNIHRKDRAAKSRPNYLSNNNNPSKQEDHGCYAGPRFYQPVFPICPPSYYISEAPNHDQEGQVYYRTYFSSTSSARPITYENSHQDPDHGVVTSPSREEMRMSLSLQFGRSHGEDQDLKRSIRGGIEEDKVDLELRLGHDP